MLACTLLAVLEMDGVGVGALVPDRLVDRGAEAEVGAQAVVVDHLFEVGLQLGLLGVGPGPVVALERVRVEVRGDIDLGPRVAVVPPGAAGPLGLLEDGEGVDARLLELDGRGDAGESAARRWRPAGVPAGPKCFRAESDFMPPPIRQHRGAGADPSAVRRCSIASFMAAAPVGIIAPMVRKPCICPS